MLRCACGHVIAGWGVIVAPEVDHACPHGDDERPDRRPAPVRLEFPMLSLTPGLGTVAWRLTSARRGFADEGPPAHPGFTWPS